VVEDRFQGDDQKAEQSHGKPKGPLPWDGQKAGAQEFDPFLIAPVDFAGYGLHVAQDFFEPLPELGEQNCEEMADGLSDHHKKGSDSLEYFHYFIHFEPLYLGECC
jgi:hypothetical protein